MPWRRRILSPVLAGLLFARSRRRPRRTRHSMSPTAVLGAHERHRQVPKSVRGVRHAGQAALRDCDRAAAFHFLRCMAEMGYDLRLREER
jgi:hypothetical protein